MKMKFNEVAVLTGDIVASRKVRNKGKLLLVLKEAFDQVENQLLNRKGSFELYRGDSFQGVIDNPSDALRAAIIIRARLRMAVQGKTEWDARIGIGVGRVSYAGKRIVESDGEAFLLSGRKLDELKKKNNRLGISTPWEDVNEELNASVALADNIISRWSTAAAEVAYYHLLNHASQTELSKQLKISQPAVHKRFNQASLHEIKLLIQRFQFLMDKYNIHE